MVELNNHVAQRAKYESAGQQARTENFDYTMHQTMDERLNLMREKQMRPKKRIPWFTIIMVVTTIPFFFMGGGDKASMGGGMTGGVSQAQMTQALATMQSMAPNEGAEVSVKIGDKTFTKTLSLSEIQALQKQQ